jgi:hypothetical protein
MSGYMMGGDALYVVTLVARAFISPSDHIYAYNYISQLQKWVYGIFLLTKLLRWFSIVTASTSGNNSYPLKPKSVDDRRNLYVLGLPFDLTKYVNYCSVTFWGNAIIGLSLLLFFLDTVPCRIV